MPWLLVLFPLCVARKHGFLLTHTDTLLSFINRSPLSTLDFFSCCIDLDPQSLHTSAWTGQNQTNHSYSWNQCCYPSGLGRVVILNITMQEGIRTALIVVQDMTSADIQVTRTTFHLVSTAPVSLLVNQVASSTSYVPGTFELQLQRNDSNVSVWDTWLIYFELYPSFYSLSGGA